MQKLFRRGCESSEIDTDDVVGERAKHVSEILKSYSSMHGLVYI